MSDDDDVYFGKYTIKEAKRDILKYVPGKIQRRHSLSCKVSKCQLNNTTEEIQANNYDSQNDENCSSEDSIITISDKSLLSPLHASEFETHKDLHVSIESFPSSKISEISKKSEHLQGNISSEATKNSVSSSGISPIQVPKMNVNQMPITKMLSPKSLDKCKRFSSAEKITKPSMEYKGSRTTVKCKYQHESKIKQPSVSARNLFIKPKKIGEESALKVPLKPVKKIPTPSKLSCPVLKNVLSPVGIYIKHSPKYIPMKKITQNTSSNPRAKITTFSKLSSTSGKENIPCASNMEFPKVIYKPARTKEIKEKKEIILPRSIQKLIKEQVITKHEQRIQDDICNQSIERRLMESDLSIDVSYNQQDISILTNKQPFNIETKRLK